MRADVAAASRVYFLCSLYNFKHCIINVWQLSAQHVDNIHVSDMFLRSRLVIASQHKLQGWAVNLSPGWHPQGLFYLSLGNAVK